MRDNDIRASGSRLRCPRSSSCCSPTPYLGLVDYSPLREIWQLLVYLVVALLMLFALRIVLHFALLREVHDPITQEPLLCQQCGHVVPDMAFCPALRGRPPAHRRGRRVLRGA